jgi:transposase InsO family protein
MTRKPRKFRLRFTYANVTATVAMFLAVGGGGALAATHLGRGTVGSAQLKAALLAREGISHRTIPPRTPKRNGKVERYQQTLKREWGLGQRYRSSTYRAEALPHWLEHYNHTRSHSSIGDRPPIARVRNVLRQDS